MKCCVPLLSLLLVGLLYAGCFEPKQEIPDEVMGLAPIYSTGDWKQIAFSEPRAIQTLGKIYYKDGIIFAGESGQGVHIIDNSDPAHPERIKFLQITGNTDIAIKGNIMYANNGGDMVAIDISRLDSAVVLSRISNAFPEVEIAGTAPPNYFGFFECADPSKGVVIGWEEKLLHKPQCWR